MAESIPDRSTFRIVDANMNRAREALRVMEEYARFALDDSTLCEDVKELRHALVQVVPEALAKRLLPAREIVGDVGRGAQTEQEYRRATVGDVALVAGKRLSEALRALEEYGKVIDPGFARAVEALRYRGYEVERRLALHARARQRFGSCRLYVLITESLCRADWFETAEAVLRGGADCLQLREKGLSAAELLERARRLVELCHNHDALLIMNDRPDVAALSHADGVHVGQHDLTVAEARHIVGGDAVVGVSTHTGEQIRAAAAEAPDYIAVGPMFATATKPQDLVPGPALLARARATCSLPLVAIGGINVSNAAKVLAAAPCCLCVCSSVISQPDAESAARSLRELIDRADHNAATVD
jgi:thiamine-phosphate pyrophosphorylase